MSWLRGHWQLLALVAGLFAIWDTALAWPVRMLIVLFHELAHGAAALLTGGSIERLELSRLEGGVIWTIGGNGFLVASAGYLGSLLIGVLLLAVAVRSRVDRAALAFCGAVIAFAVVFYVRDLFTAGYALAVAASMLAIAILLPAVVSDLVLRVIGLSSMLYVPWDIWDDTIRDRPLGEGLSDAAAIASRTFGTEAMWGVIWLILSLVVIVASLRWGLGAQSNIARQTLTRR